MRPLIVIAVAASLAGTAAAGIQYPFRQREWGHLFASAQAYADRMVGSSGPTWYWGGGLAVGFSYDFGSGK